MPKNLADFGQRGAAAQHARRQRVPKLMRPRGGRRNARPVQRVPNDGSNGTLAEKALDRCLAPEKHTTTGAGWTSVAQIRGNGGADIRRQREDGFVTAFAADAHLPGLPLDVL